eukprot:67633_1
MSRSAADLSIVYDGFLIICLLFLLTFHAYLQHHILLYHRQQKISFRQTLILSKLTYFVIVMTSCVYLLDICMYLVNIITIPSCTAKILLATVFFVAQKIGIYLFIIFRTQINQIMHSQGQSYTIWFKIGLCLICTYFGLIVMNFVLILSNKRQIIIIDGVCGSTGIKEFGMWQIIADFVIGVYCLVVFVFPLRKLLINTEQNENNASSKSTIKKVIIYSLIAIITSLLLYPIQIILITFGIFAGSSLIYLDMFVNVYCIVMQFTNIDFLTTITSVYWRRIITFTQYCTCSIANDESVIKCDVTMEDIDATETLMIDSKSAKKIPSTTSNDVTDGSTVVEVPQLQKDRVSSLTPKTTTF